MVYNWFWLIVGVVVGAVLYLCFTPIFGGVVDETNDLITDGSISQQTANTVSFNTSMLYLSPVIVIVGFLLAVYIRGVNEKRRSGGF